MTLFFFESVLWTSCVFVEALLVLRLLRDGLIRKYPFFAAFLLADLICGVILLQTDVRSARYSDAFRVCTMIMTLFRLGMAGELYERICAHFPGMGTFRAGLAASLVVAAALIAAATFPPNLVDQWGFPRTTVLVIQRFQSEIFAAAFVLTWVFLRYILRIEQPFQRNVVNHWWIVVSYFSISGIAHLTALLSGKEMTVLTINCAMLAAQLTCFICWFLLLHRSGEQMPAFGRLSPEQVTFVEQYHRELFRTITSLPDEIAGR